MSTENGAKALKVRYFSENVLDKRRRVEAPRKHWGRLWDDLGWLGTIGMAVGAVWMLSGTIGMALSTIEMALGTIGMALGTIGMPWGTIGMALGTIRMALGTIGMKSTKSLHFFILSGACLKSP